MLKSLLRKRNAEGFTLVELMIVVAIIGVLAALAIYGVSRYLRHSKTAEATRSLGAIETGNKTKYQKESIQDADVTTGTTSHYFCGFAGEAAAGTPNKTPATIPAAQKAQGDYLTNKLWSCLQFSLSAPQFYQYDYVSTANTGTAAIYTVDANGDLDGNTVSSKFELKGKIVDGEATRDGAIVITNEDE
jgi:type IV pilus assembly protein PilA